MNPPNQTNGEFLLPQPVAGPGQPPGAPNYVDSLDVPIEGIPAQAFSPENGANQMAQPAVGGMQNPLPPMPQPGFSAAPPAANPSASDVVLTTQSAVPVTADDVDLIEKEWVNKAKQIVERNREDPHEQSKQITSFKADYMKKRYNKELKLSE